jgi:Streptomyces sporulation and cell division protein, SsgA
MGGLTMKSSTVSAELELRCVLPQRETAPVAATLCYSSEDPYAIRIAFNIGTDEPVEWTFARDLLSMGMIGRQGICDVRVWPSTGSQNGTPGSVLNIELCSPYGQAHFEAQVTQVSDFVRQTYQIVPAGEESNYLDIESELTDLLRREA